MKTEKAFDKRILVFFLVAAAAAALFGADPSPTKLAFGPGQGSRFYVNTNEKAVVVGVSSLTWENFAKRTYKGEQSETDHSTHSYWVFDDARIVDAEKNSTKDDYDDCWCSALSRMNICFWGGWIGGYANEDAVKDYLRKQVDGSAADSGGWDFENLLPQSYFSDSVVGGVSSLKEFTASFEGADRLFVLGIVYDNTYIWKGYAGVAHEVVCCGYSLDVRKSVTDPAALKAIFIIDSDNDMYNGAGGSSAPDSITYCPVSWNAAKQCYVATGVFGATGTFTFDFMSYIRAKKTPSVYFTSAAASKSNAYTVKFDGNGATSGTMKNQSFTYGKAQALTANAFKRTNYHLKGWSKTKGGKLAYTDKQSVKNLTSKAGATVTLYAVWELSTYKVKFDANGGTGTMKAQSINAGAEKALTANAYKRTGYTFLGWAKKKDATKADYKDKAKVKNLSTKNGATVALYAVWKANSYMVKFNANGGTGKMKDLAMTYGKAKALTANAFKRTNFTFLGWSKAKGATKADYKNKASVKNLKASGTVTLYAVWKRNTYSIAFDANGGAGTMKTQSAGCGEAAKLSANAFKRAGFTFKGWATSKTATTAKYSNKAKVKDLAKANKGVTLYAVWWISAENVVGSYEGMAGFFDGDEEDDESYGCAVVKLDVAKTGSVSATVSMMGKNYSFSSAKPSSYRASDAAYIYNMKAKDGARLGLVLDTKLSGFDAKFLLFGDRCASTFTTPAYEEDFRVFLWKNGHGASGAIESDPVARDHVANIKSLKKVYLKVGKGDGSGAYPLAKATSATADMTLSIGADGVVTLSGKALGASVSGKSMLKIDDDSYYTICDFILPNVPERGKISYLPIGFSPYEDGFKLSNKVWCDADLLVFEP